MNIAEIIETASRKVNHVYGGVFIDRDDFRQIGRIAAWRMNPDRMRGGLVYRIIKRRMLDYGRSCARRRINFVPIDGSEIDKASSPLGVFLEKEKWRMVEGLQQLLVSPNLVLTSKQRTAMQLYFIDGLTMDEISQISGCTECAISFVIQGGIARMKAFLSSEQNINRSGG